MKSLIGRTVLIDFHNWNFANVPGNTPAEKVAYICADSNALYGTMGKHYNEEAEIIGYDSDKGCQMLFADGTIGPGSEMFFKVLPKKPEPLKGWEYKTIRALEGMTDRELNKLGAEGWEAVAAQDKTSRSETTWTTHYLFKRPIQKK